MYLSCYSACDFISRCGFAPGFWAARCFDMELSVETEKPPWARQLKRRGFYFEGLVDSDDVETLLEGHRRDTVTSYGTRTSSKVTADDGTGDKQVAQNLQVLLY